MGAGTGRLAIPLARSGKDVYCVEPSRAMRDVLRARVRRGPPLRGSVHIISSSASDFEMDSEFSIVLLSGVFEHFLEEGPSNPLGNIVSHMAKNAILVFDVLVGSMLSMPMRLTDRVTFGDKEYKRYIERNVCGNRLNLEIIYESYRNGVLQDGAHQPSSSVVVGLDEVKEVLRVSGLRINKM